MNCDDFETLTVHICNKILGPATIPFAKGKDGGKDGKFVGKANCIPSEADPWNGTIIIQAKHTEKPGETCSSPSFNKTLKNEVIPAIKKLKDNKEIDYYLLFTNRPLSGIKETDIEKTLKEETGIPCLLFANEKIQEFLTLYPEIVKAAELNRLLMPLDFDESDIREVIIEMADFLKSNNTASKENFDYPGLDKKNEINKMSIEYFETSIKDSMNSFGKIESFLSNPINDEILDIYEDAKAELKAKLSQYRDRYDNYNELLESAHDLIIADKQALKGKKRLVRLLLHYMYCNCEIGRK